MTKAVKTPAVKPAPRASAKQRALDAAYDLFRINGTRSIGIDAIVQRSGVAKMSLYRHFRSKEELITAFLKRREELWTIDWLKSELYRRAASPADRLLVVFDLFDGWYQSSEFDGCSFINVLLEYPKGHKARLSATAHLATIRDIFEELARSLEIKEAQTFANTWHMMMKGSIVAACEGNLGAAREIKVAAQLYLENSLRTRDQSIR